MGWLEPQFEPSLLSVPHPAGKLNTPLHACQVAQTLSMKLFCEAVKHGNVSE